MSNPQTQAYFEQNARQWDGLRAGYFGDAVREVAMAKACLTPEMSVADIGAGTGFIAQGLAPLVRQVHLVDPSPAMLEQARANLAGHTNCQYHTADAAALPLPDASVDAAFANMALHHCPDPLAAIREMARILRPGGRLVITDLDEHDHTWMRSEMADTWLGFPRGQVLAWLEQAGLVNRYIDCVGQSCNAQPSGDAGQKAQVSIFVAVGTKRIGSHEDVQNNYAAKAGCCGSDDGSCCSPGVISLDTLGSAEWNTHYSSEDRLAAPSAAYEMSLGCGNPLAVAALRPGQVVLDIGSGGGLDAFLAARRVGDSGHVYGIDMTPAMLQKARQTAKDAGIANITFRHGYAEHLPMTDASVDVVISNCVINLTEDKGAAFAEAFRVLRPGGRLEINDVAFEGSVPPSVWAYQPGWSECVSGALPLAELLDLIRQAGFEPPQVTPGASGGNLHGAAFRSYQFSAGKPAL